MVRTTKTSPKISARYLPVQSSISTTNQKSKLLNEEQDKKQSDFRVQHRTSNSTKSTSYEFSLTLKWLESTKQQQQQSLVNKSKSGQPASWRRASQIRLVNLKVTKNKTRGKEKKNCFLSQRHFSMFVRSEFTEQTVVILVHLYRIS